MAIYMQHDLLPAAMPEYWASTGNTVGNIMTWLNVPTDMGNVALTNLEAAATDHCSALSYVLPRNRSRRWRGQT